jgi:hypothetical protein
MFNVSDMIDKKLANGMYHLGALNSLTNANASTSYHASMAGFNYREHTQTFHDPSTGGQVGTLKNPPVAYRLYLWWQRLKKRGAELGEDGMDYAEWSEWSDQLDAFKKDAR